MIAHRLSTISGADLILVMNNGELVEAGPHRELLRSDGLYRQLHDVQAPVANALRGVKNRLLERMLERMAEPEEAVRERLQALAGQHASLEPPSAKPVDEELPPLRLVREADG